MNLSTSNSSSSAGGNHGSGSSASWRRYAGIFFLFVLFLFLFDRGGYHLIKWSEREFYRNSFETEFTEYMKGKEFSTLIFGSSRTYEGIHPAYLEPLLKQRFFKESFRGKGPKYNYYFYLLYKKVAGVPKVVIYGVDYFVHTQVSYPRWMSRFDEEKTQPEDKELGFWEPKLLLWAYKNGIDNFHNNIMLRFRGKMRKPVAPKNNDEKEDTAEEYERLQKYEGANPEKKNMVSEQPAEYLRQAYPLHPGKEGRYLVKLFEELQKDNVPVVLVGLPDFFGSYKTNFMRDRFISDLKHWRTQFGNIRLLNYNRPIRFPLNDPHYFLDGGWGMTNSHLSSAGAKLLCEMLAEDIKDLYEQKESSVN